MASLGGFKMTEQDTSQNSVLPLGNYALEVSASEMKDTKAGTGQLLAVTMDVLEPEQFHGRKVFYNFNLTNPNPTAQKIGRDELAKLCRAIGLNQDPDDSEELHFKRFVAKIGLEKAQEGYEPKNKPVRFYYPDEGDLPEPGLLDAPPAVKSAPRPANDNRPAAGNDNGARSTQNGGSAKTPWGKK